MKKNSIYLILVLALLLGQNGISNANSGDPMNVNTKALEKIEVDKIENADLEGYCNSRPVIQEKVLNPDLEQPQKEEKETITHIVQKGESLWKIAQQYLGDGNRWPELIDLNKGDYPSLETKPNLIYVGWKIKVVLDKEEKTDTEIKTDITTNTEVATDTKVLPDDQNKPNVVIDENNAKPEEEIVKGPVWTIEQKITKLQDAVEKMNRLMFAAGRGDSVSKFDKKTIDRMIKYKVLTQEDWMAMNPPIGYTYVIRNNKVVLIDSKNVALTSDDIAKLDKELADKYTRRNNTNTNTNTTTNPTHNSWTFTTTTTRIATDTNNVISPRPNTNTNINVKPDKPSDFIEREGRLKDTMTKTFTFTDINIDPRDPRSKLDPITYTKTITNTNTNTNTKTKTKTNTNTNTNTKNNTNTKTNTNTNRGGLDPRDPRSKFGTLTYTWTYYNTNTKTNTSVATPTYVNNGSNRNTNSSVATPPYVNNNNSNSNRGDNRNTPASNLGQSLGDLFKAVQDAGKEIGQAGKELGKTVSDAGKGIAKDFKDMGQEFKKAGQDIANEAKQTGQDVADGVKQTGQELKRAGEDVVDGFKQAGEDFEDGFNRGSGRDGYRRHGSHGGRGRRR